MKRIYILFTLLLFTIIAHAQTTVKGVLVDSLTNEGEPYATIRICKEKQENKPVVMAVTDLDGKFSPQIKDNGKYVISFSSVGRTTVKRTFTVEGQKVIDLGTILAYDDEKTLESVEVVAQKPLVKMEADKMTYSVEDDVDSKSLSVLDMLRKVPMVTVDGQDNITVNGSSSFKIYVNGKQNPMFSSNASTIFKAMPASSVSSIEVITNPGAKFDAEGAGGILDIKLATATMGGATANGAGDNGSLNGYNGSISVSGGNKGFGGSAYVAGQQGKFSYNANLSSQYVDNGAVTVEMLREQKDGSTMKYTQETKNTVPIIFGTLAMGYELDPLSSLNMNLGLTKFNLKNSGNPLTELSGGFYGKGGSYSNFTQTKMSTNSFNGSIDYQHFFNNTRTSYVTLTYQLNTNPGKNDTETNGFKVEGDVYGVDLTENSNNGTTNTIEHVSQADFVNKLSDHQTLNYGLKYANRKSSSVNDFFYGGQMNDDRSVDYSNTDQIGALYAELENRWTFLTVKGGLRYEQTWQSVKFNKGKGESFTKNYGNLVPTASISLPTSLASSLGLTYNMRIARPGITYLNPYVDRSQPTSISYGDPTITTEKTHNIGLVYNSYSSKLMWNATLKQTFGTGGIEQFSFFEDNIMHTTYGNIVNRRVTSLNIFASWSMTNSTRVIFNGSGSYNDFRSKQLDRNTYGWMGNAMVSVQQKLPQNWNLSASAITNSKSVTLQGNSAGMNIGVFSVTKNMLDDRLNMSASFVTGLSKGGNLHMNQYTEGKDFTSSTNITVPITRVQLSVTWQFGNTKRQFQKHQSKVESDYIEHKSDSENIGNAGNM